MAKTRPPLRLAQEVLLNPASLDPPIPFVTARRFWILVYLYLATAGLSALLARFLVRPILARILVARREQTAHAAGLLAGLVKTAGVAVNISRQEAGGVVVDTQRHRLLVHSYTQTGEDADPVPQRLEQVQEPAPAKGIDATLTELQKTVAPLASEDEGSAYADALGRSAAFKEYLDSLDPHAYARSYGASGGASSTDKGIQKCKAEIRSVKGSVLNARNFPSRMAMQSQAQSQAQAQSQGQSQSQSQAQSQSQQQQQTSQPSQVSQQATVTTVPESKPDQIALPNVVSEKESSPNTST